MTIDCEQALATRLKQNNYQITYPYINNAKPEEFQKIRMMGFGASDSSKLLDVNPFPGGTLADVINEKINGDSDPSIGKKPSVRKGKELEELILNKTQKILSTIYGRYCYVYKPYNQYGSEETHLNTNFDGILFHNIIVDKKDDIGPFFPVEAKLVTKYGQKYYTWSKSMLYEFDGELQPIRKGRDELAPFEAKDIKNISDYCKAAAEYYGIPVYYYTQLQQQIMFLDKDFGYLAVLDDDNWNMHIFKIHASSLVHNALKNIAIHAWGKVQVTKDLREEKNK